jgi:Spy/CpxP family protein refolding chaperone
MRAGPGTIFCPGVSKFEEGVIRMKTRMMVAVAALVVMVFAAGIACAGEPGLSSGKTGRPEALPKGEPGLSSGKTGRPEALPRGEPGGEHRGGKGKGDGKDKHFEEMSKGLGLSNEQKDALLKHREATKPKMEELREKSHAARQALMAEIDKTTPDKERISSIVAQMEELAGEKVQAMVDRMLFMKQVLTPEQSAKMREIMEKKKEEFKGRRGGRGAHSTEGPGGPPPE